MSENNFLLTVRARSLLTASLEYLWSGWGAIASLLLFLAFWDLGYQVYGSLILPSPMETFLSLIRLYQDGILTEALEITAYRSIVAFLMALFLGSLLGFLAGLSMTAAMVSRPLITVILGIPPIAWVVLAMLWFGASDASPIFTVLVATVPLIFVGALQGTRTLDGNLKVMADAYNLPWTMRFKDVYLPHILSYLFPAWISALGLSWKVVVMAELLATADGVGAELAVARAQLDTAATMAWIVGVVVILLLVEYLILEPIKIKAEQWRDDEHS